MAKLKIVDEQEQSANFNNLPIGQVYRYGSELYMKIDSHATYNNAYSLKTNRQFSHEGDTVTPVEATLTIEE